MEVRFAPVSPTQPVRPAPDARLRPAASPPPEPRVDLQPGGSSEAARTVGSNAAERGRTEPGSRALRADLQRVRVQPELPPVTRNALQTFVNNSFSDEEDPAAGLGRIDVFV